jgi:hypothetical protein
MEDAVIELKAIVQQQAKMLEILLKDKALKKEDDLNQSSSKSSTFANPEFVMESLAKSMTEFSYDPENGVTFQAWYARYEDLFTFDASTLEDSAKVRLLLRKLNTSEHQRYLNYILPKVPKEFKFKETVDRLKDIFGVRESIFSIRYKCLQIAKKKDEDYVTYASRINKNCEDFQLNNFKSDQFKSLIFVIGLKSQDEADIRTRLLSKLEDDSEDKPITLETLKTECDRIRNLKTDTALISSKPLSVHYINKNVKKFHQKSEKDNRNSSKSSSDQPKYPCWQCGAMHLVKFCTYTDHTCKDCSKKGHKEGYCSCIGNKKNKDSTLKNQNSNKPKVKPKNCNGIWNINSVNAESQRKFIKIEINNFPIIMQLDTASDVTIISSSTWKSLGSPKLATPSQTAKNASGFDIDFLGEFQCNVKFKTKLSKGNCLVFKNNNLNLLGLDFINQLKLCDQSINSICNAINLQSKTSIIDKFKSDFPQLFRNELGKCIKKVKLHIKPNSKPVFCQKRPVAFSVIEMVDAELQRLEQNGIITPVSYSNWAAPIVVVKKASGKIRLCVDFSTGLNSALESHDYPLPTPDDIFSKMAGCSIFSKIDLSDAYFQVEVDEESKELLVFNTHRGLFRMNRLAQGAKPASGIFQQLMETIFSGEQNVQVNIDDVIIASSNLKEHLATLRRALQKLDDNGFTIKIEKCEFLMEELKFLGKIVNSKGTRPDPAKIDTIINLPEPTNVSQLRSLLGSINAFAKHIPNMRKLRATFDELLKKGNEWNFNQKCKDSFQQFKKVLTSDLCLTHYDPKLKIIVAADAWFQKSYSIRLKISHQSSEKL